MNAGEAPARVLSRGLYEWHAEGAWDEAGGGRWYGSGFGYGPEPQPFGGHVWARGCLLVDKRAVLERDPSFCWRSPMPGPEAQRLGEVSPIFAGAVAGNAFGGLLALQARHEQASREPGPLDTVTVAEFAAWWRAAGARVGWWDGDRINWESEVGR